jgi:hypothetical protein
MKQPRLGQVMTLSVQLMICLSHQVQAVRLQYGCCACLVFRVGAARHDDDGSFHVYIQQ